jgi:starch-binding outer membrane protein, SusD/RagB family
MNKNRINYLIVLASAIIVVAGCSKDFLDQPPASSVTANTFYKTDDQLLAGTSLLYSKVWFDEEM